MDLLILLGVRERIHGLFEIDLWIDLRVTTGQLKGKAKFLKISSERNFD